MSTIVKVGDEKTDIVVKDSQGNQKETFVSEEGELYTAFFRRPSQLRWGASNSLIVGEGEEGGRN